MQSARFHGFSPKIAGAVGGALLALTAAGAQKPGAAPKPETGSDAPPQSAASPFPNPNPLPQSKDPATPKESPPKDPKTPADLLIDPQALERERARRNLEWDPLETRQKKSGGGLGAYLHDEVKYYGYYETAQGRLAGFRVQTQIGLLFAGHNARLWNGRILEINPEYVLVSVKNRPSDKNEMQVKIYRQTRKNREGDGKTARKPRRETQPEP